MKTAPENKNFLYVVIGLAILLLGYHFMPTLISSPSQEKQGVSFEEVKNVVGKELSIRQRHVQLKKALYCWNGRFLSGTKREAELVLMKKVEAWAGSCGLVYESTQIIADRSNDNVQLEVKGNAPYLTIRKFLSEVEQARFAVSVSAIRLRKEDTGEILHYELTLTTPVLIGGETL